MEFSQLVTQNKHSHKVALKPVRQTLSWCGRRVAFKRSFLLITKYEGKSKVLCSGLCLPDSEAKREALQFLHMQHSNVSRYSSAPKLLKQNPPDRTLDLPVFFLLKHITSLKDHPSLALGESLPYWFQGNFAAMFVLNYWSREFLWSEIANRFELRCESKQLMLLYYPLLDCSTPPPPIIEGGVILISISCLLHFIVN